VAVKIPVNQTKVRTLSVADVPVLFKQLQQVLLECEKLLNDSKYIALYHHGVLPSASEIMESIEFILNEDDLLKNFSIYDELCASKLIALLDIYAPAI
jgi:hypothetical protein